MKRTTLALALTLLGGTATIGAAAAQTPPTPKPPAPAAAPTPPAPAPAVLQAPPAPQPQQGAQAAAPAVPTPSGPPEGMIVETPNGFYLVRPGEANPQRLDLGRNGMGPMGGNEVGMGPQGRAGMDRPMTSGNDMAGPDDEMDGGMAGAGMQPPPPPHPHHPPRPPEGKGARLSIHTPNLDVNVKCPDDEPIKACVDAISQLMDKTNAAAH